MQTAIEFYHLPGQTDGSLRMFAEVVTRVKGVPTCLLAFVKSSSPESRFSLPDEDLTPSEALAIAERWRDATLPEMVGAGWRGLTEEERRRLTSSLGFSPSPPESSLGACDLCGSGDPTAPLIPDCYACCEVARAAVAAEAAVCRAIRKPREEKRYDD